MLPWMEIPALTIGQLSLQPYPLFLAAAVLAGRSAFLNAATARAFRVDLAKAFYATVILASALAGAVSIVAREPGILRLHPRTWPELLLASSSWAGIGGGAAAALALAWFARLDRRQAWMMCDSFAWAFPFGWLVLRLGCAWTHHHPGVVSASVFAVRYPGRPRHDLALLEALLCVGLLLLWTALRRRRFAEGLVSGIVLVAVGGFRYATNGLRLDQAAGGWELALPAALIALGGGSILYGWLRGQGGDCERQSKLERVVA
jgi:prolipoprotein diacylglyceryltransferase